MEHQGLQLAIGTDHVLNCSVQLVAEIFEVPLQVVHSDHIRPRLVDAANNSSYNTTREIVTKLYDCYCQRVGKSELTRDRKWDNIPKCYYLGFKKSGKKLVPPWFEWFDDMLVQWRHFQERASTGCGVNISDIPAELLRLNRVLRQRQHIGWAYISIVDFILLPLMQSVLQELLSLEALREQIGELTVNLLRWLEYIQARPEVLQLKATHESFALVDVPHLVFSTLQREWSVFKRGAGPSVALAVSDRRHHQGLASTVTWDSVIAKLGNITLLYDDDTAGIENGVPVSSKNRTLASEHHVDWAEVPAALDPARGLGEHVQRLERKRDQLSGLAHVIGAMLQPGDTVVDFCGGGGHLTLVLATLFPRNQFVLLDKNDVSLSLAQKRIRALNLPNISVVLADVQAVLDGTVPVTCSLGLALHACGALTDLVLDYCLATRAAYVLVPCCLGAIANWHGGAGIRYPRSAAYGACVTLEDYLLLASRADQTACASDTSAYWLGKHAMGLINHDRNLYAAQQGYSTAHVTLQPSSATPKNDVICGAPPGHEQRIVNMFVA